MTQNDKHMICNSDKHMTSADCDYRGGALTTLFKVFTDLYM